MAGLLSSVKDPLLRRLVTRMEGALKPEMRRNYDAIVVAGMKLMFSEGTHHFMDEYLENIKSPEDVPRIIAHGIVKLLSIIQNQSKKQEPFPSAGPACISLMAMALEFVEKRNKIDIDNRIIDETSMLIKEGIFALYKITPEAMQAIQNQKAKQPGEQAQEPLAAQPPPEQAPSAQAPPVAA